jgi:hypothetical protein
MDHQAAA